MCKIKGVTVGIKDLNFTAHRGKMAAKLTDGREVMLLLGGSISAGSVSISGFVAILIAAFIGAMASSLLMP